MSTCFRTIRDLEVHASRINKEQILEADAIWAVFYKAEPFNLKSFNSLTSYPGPKYKKVSFSNPGHAHNLAKKLNLTFGTEDFQVVKLTQGTIIK